MEIKRPLKRVGSIFRFLIWCTINYDTDRLSVARLLKTKDQVMNKQLKKFASLALAGALALATSSAAFAQGGAAAGEATATATTTTQSGLSAILANLGLSVPAGLGVIGTATVAIIGSAVVITNAVEDNEGNTTVTTTVVGTTDATTL